MKSLTMLHMVFAIGLVSFTAALASAKMNTTVSANNTEIIPPRLISKPEFNYCSRESTLLRLDNLARITTLHIMTGEAKVSSNSATKMLEIANQWDREWERFGATDPALAAFNAALVKESKSSAARFFFYTTCRRLKSIPESIPDTDLIRKLEDQLERLYLGDERC